MRAEDAVAFAFRDHEDQAEFGSQPLPPEMRTYDLHAVRRMGVEDAARAAVDHLARAELDGFFIHLDADCLDDAIMPAVDFRVPGGLSWDELEAVLRIVLASGKAVGLEVAIYNPRLDEDGSAGRGLADVLAAALGPGGALTLHIAGAMPFECIFDSGDEVCANLDHISRSMRFYEQLGWKHKSRSPTIWTRWRQYGAGPMPCCRCTDRDAAVQDRDDPDARRARMEL